MFYVLVQRIGASSVEFEQRDKNGDPKVGNPKNAVGMSYLGPCVPMTFPLHFWGSLLWGPHVCPFIEVGGSRIDL